MRSIVTANLDAIRRGHVAFVLALALSSGCIAAPRPASTIGKEVAPKVVANASAKDAAVSRAGYWEQTGPDDSSRLLAKGRKVVITGFDVELVNLQFQPKLEKQLLIKPPPFAYSVVGLAGVGVELIGLGRKNTRLSEDEQRALTKDLYAAFLDDLKGRGLEVVSQETLAASAGFAGLSKRSVVKSSPLMLLNPLGSDTGQVMHTRTIAAPGLGVRRRWSYGREAAQAEILAATHADVAIDVCLRVGIYRTKAALEHRSTFRLTTADGQTLLKARASILSDADVIGETRFIPVAGRSLPVHADAFARELKAMLPEFVTLALEAPKETSESDRNVSKSSN